MNGPSSKDRLSPPLMHAFRAAHAARDAKTKLDLRDKEGERIIASRRSMKRGAITEPMLRREVAIDLEALMNTSRSNRASTCPSSITSAARS